uniref:Carboxylic ester hydrolase n=1 Tax=Holotrichia parallela TaxID=93412 RepID=A0A2P1ERP2_HOLPA|nr:odorant degrading protein 18 [Holotrichia parallela]
MKLQIILISFLASTINCENDLKAPEVEISNGLLQGVHEKSFNGRIFSSFHGIPYARPPVGELRFEAPKEPYNWTGIWIANTKHTCLQTILKSIITGDEDCLYLNVYVPRANPSPSDNFNVIVHIHGGGFSMGSGHEYGPKYLMDEEVIVVTMNYRLGPFGFLSTQDEIVPGNNGLKDQALSLQWIQKNIKYFGGNPNSVTITGVSAGGSSVHLHYFSPLSKGKFHRGVSQSGCALNPWAIAHAPGKSATQLADILGCPTETSKELIDCLKSRSGIKIAEALKSLSAVWPLTYVPVVEPEHDGAFLTQHPYNMLLDKTVTDVPWISSVVGREGLIAYMLIPEVLSKVGENFESSIPHILLYNDNDEDVQKIVTDKIREYYFKENFVNVAENVIDILGDRFFLSGTGVALKLQAIANKSPVYFYNFRYRGEHSLDELFGSKLNSSDVAHGDDIQYYLHISAFGESLSESDARMKSIFTQWLSSFAETDEPKIEGVKWNAVSGGDVIEYLNFKDPDNLLADVTRDLGAGSFWSNLPLKENELQKRIKDEL